MRKRSKESPDLEALREKIIGLGERSFRKSYYPKLLQQMKELQRFRALLDQSSDAIFLMEVPSGRIIDVNESACRQLLLSREKLLSLTLADIAEPLPPDTIELLLHSESGDKAQTTLETVLLRSDNAKIPVEITIRIVDFGGIAYSVWAARDITERKQAEKETAELLGQLRAIFDHIPIGIAYLDADFKFIKANTYFCNLCSCREDELIGRPCYETMGEYVGDPIRKGLEKICSFCKKDECIRMKKPTVIERPLGDLILRFQTMPELGEQGGITKFLEIVEDITTRKRLEESLREGERLFREITESLPQLIWTTDGRGSCDYLSRQWVEYTGIAAADQLGDQWIKAIHPDDRSKSWELWNRFLQGETDYDLEYRLRRHDGEYRWFKTRAIPIHDERGRTVKVFGSCTDIDDKMRAEESLRKMGDELQLSNRELEQFAYVVSHDLREPLRTISGFLNLVQKKSRDRLDAQGNEYIDYAVQGAERLDRMILDLLEYSKIHRQELTRRPVSLFDIWLEAVENLRYLIEDTGTRITHDPLPMVRGDTGQLVRLLQNLIGNAITYCKGRKPRIHIGVASEGDHWRIAVQDNGIGIEPEHQKRIFKIFQRLHTQKEYPGTGIGLAICQKIVERHGGCIWVDSEPGKGSTFYFTLSKAG